MRPRDPHYQCPDILPDPLSDPVGEDADAGLPAARDLWRDRQSLRLETTNGSGATAFVEIDDLLEPDRKILTCRTMLEIPGGTVVRSRFRSILDPRTGRTLEHHRHCDDEHRKYLFRPKGYTVETMRAGSDVDDEPTGWQVLTRREFRAPVEGYARVPVPLYDFLGMLEQLRNPRPMIVGEAIDYWIATTCGPRPCRILVADSTRSKREIRDADRGRVRALDIHQLSLQISELDSECNDELFLGMDADAEIVVEASSKSLLELHGSVPDFGGEVDLYLTAMA